MVKKVFLAAVATLILAGATVSIQPNPADAKIFHGCWKAAKAAGVKGMKARREYRKACRAHYKATKRAK